MDENEKMNNPTQDEDTTVDTTKPMVMSILGTHDLIVRPAGVKVRVDCSTEDAETFGFVDLNPRVAGFGEGKFAQSIN